MGYYDYDHGELYDGESALWAPVRPAPDSRPVFVASIDHWFYDDEIEPCAIGGKARWKVKCQGRGCDRILYGPDRAALRSKMLAHSAVAVA